MSAFVFIYSKGGKIKCLDSEAAFHNERNLISEGWAHTHTINAATFIQYLHTLPDEEILREVKELNKP